MYSCPNCDKPMTWATHGFCSIYCEDMAALPTPQPEGPSASASSAPKFYALYVCGEDSDEVFGVHHPLFFADFDSAQKYIKEANDDCDERFGQYVGPFMVPTLNDLLTLNHYR